MRLLDGKGNMRMALLLDVDGGRVWFVEGNGRPVDLQGDK